jgi:aarF domain-containing kinase
VIDPGTFCQEMSTIVSEVHRNGLTLGKIGVGELLQRVLVLCYHHRVKLESNFSSVVIAMGVLEGLGRRLDPDINLLKLAAPYVLSAALQSDPKS